MRSSVATITSGPASTRLTTLDTAKDDLQSPSSDDARVSRLIDRASGVIADDRGGPYGFVTVEETFRIRSDWGLSNFSLILRYRPVVVIASVIEDGIALSADAVELDANAGLLYRLSGTRRCRFSCSEVVVTYDAGYGMPGDSPRTLPASVEEVCLDLVRAGYMAAGTDTTIISDSSPELGTIRWQRQAGGVMSLDDAMCARLVNYRLSVGA